MTFFVEFYEKLLDTHNEFIFLYFIGRALAFKEHSHKETFWYNVKRYFEVKELGKLELASRRKKYFIFRLYGSPFKTRKKQFSCAVIAGLLAGFVENYYKIPTGAIETKCISMGHGYCEFKVKLLK